VIRVLASDLGCLNVGMPVVVVMLGLGIRVGLGTSPSLPSLSHGLPAVILGPSESLPWTADSESILGSRLSQPGLGPSSLNSDCVSRIFSQWVCRRRAATASLRQARRRASGSARRSPPQHGPARPGSRRCGAGPSLLSRRPGRAAGPAGTHSTRLIMMHWHVSDVEVLSFRLLRIRVCLRVTVQACSPCHGLARARPVIRAPKTGAQASRSGRPFTDHRDWLCPGQLS
jgi:hypothetical protein